MRLCTYLWCEDKTWINLAIIVFLSANLQSHSYTKRFPKGTAQRKNSEKGGGRVWVIGLYFRARAELDTEEKNTTVKNALCL